MNIKKFTDKELQKITRLASKSRSQAAISETMGFSNSLFTDNQEVRSAWLKGRETVMKIADKSYLELLKEGYWPTIKHYRAINCGEIEPKQPEVVVQALEGIKIIKDTGPKDVKIAE